MGIRSLACSVYKHFMVASAPGSRQTRLRPMGVSLGCELNFVSTSCIAASSPSAIICKYMLTKNLIKYDTYLSFVLIHCYDKSDRWRHLLPLA